MANGDQLQAETAVAKSESADLTGAESGNFSKESYAALHSQVADLSSYADILRDDSADLHDRISGLETAVQDRFSALETTMQNRFSALERAMQDRVSGLETTVKELKDIVEQQTKLINSLAGQNPDGATQNSPDGSPVGSPDNNPDGSPDNSPEGTAQNSPEESPEGDVDLTSAERIKSIIAECSIGVPELSDERLGEVSQALDDYAKLSAKHRKGYVGRFLRTSSFIAKIPGVRFLAEKLNSRSDRDLDASRIAYETAIRSARGDIAILVSDQFATNSANPEDLAAQSAEIDRQIFLKSATLVSLVDDVFETKLVAERMAQSKKTTRFVNWWVRQSGLGGRLKQYASMAGSGAITGGVAAAVAAFVGVPLLPVVGAVVGGASALAINRHITNRRANAVEVKGGQVTVAERQSTNDRALKTRKLEGIIDSYNSTDNPDSPDNNTDSANGNPDSVVNPDNPDNPDSADRSQPDIERELTRLTEFSTAEQIATNRRQATAALVAGIAGGKILGLGVGFVKSGGVAHLAQSFNPSKQTPGGGTTGSGTTGGPTVNNDLDTLRRGHYTERFPAPADQLPLNGDPTGVNHLSAVSGGNFSDTLVNIPSSAGYENVMHNYVLANSGVNLSGGQSSQLVEHLRSLFGDDFINIHNAAGSDIYPLVGGDVGLSAPGPANLIDSVPGATKAWLISKGLL